ncbi:hypothetical protein WKH56_06315 [Priestia sp. SB1]|uniref:hypothetical protein n=1 Tax=Priestia sp. SB1 TaxID=3132359 RepID=UPI00316F8121
MKTEKSYYDFTTEERINDEGKVDIKHDLRGIIADQGYIYTKEEFVNIEKSFMAKLINNNYVQLAIETIEESDLRKPVFTMNNLLEGYIYELDSIIAVEKCKHNQQFKLEKVDERLGLTVTMLEGKDKGRVRYPFPSQIKNSCTLKK